MKLGRPRPGCCRSAVNGNVACSRLPRSHGYDEPFRSSRQNIASPNPGAFKLQRHYRQMSDSRLSYIAHLELWPVWRFSLVIALKVESQYGVSRRWEAVAGIISRCRTRM